ncbi:MAG: universal stress protein [Acidimicrobiia bacterium]|nr:universal stress protein [Acidimicrobiia bacterium]
MEDTRTHAPVDLGTGSPLTRIVVLMMLDEHDDHGVAVGARLAERWAFPIKLVSLDPSADDAVTMSAGQAVEAARGTLAAAHPALDVSDEIIAAAHDPAVALAASLATSDLVVVSGAATAGERTESLAQTLAHEWGGPIMMIGPHMGLDTIDGDVVVGVDGSALSERGLPVAIGLAAAFGAQLWVVQVVPSSVTDHVERLKARGERVSETSYIHDLVEGLGPSVRWEIIHGDEPAAALVDCADRHNASALVMATHGRSALPRPVFGSVCMEAVRRATRPVMVIRPTKVSPELALGS